MQVFKCMLLLRALIFVHTCKFCQFLYYSLAARLSIATGGEGSDTSGCVVSRAQINLLMAMMRQGLRDETFALFGLNTACYVVTKFLRPLVKHWRSHGRRAIVYIDDGICATSNVQEAEQHSAAIQLGISPKLDLFSTLTNPAWCHIRLVSALVSLLIW